MSQLLRQRLKEIFGPRWTVTARGLLRGYELPRWGNLRRTQPLSQNFGFERGTPVDRYYLEKFFEQHRSLITGDVLEIQVTGYTQRYGHHLRRTHSIDINPQMQPTFVCDLAQSEGIIPSLSYDCFLLPNTLSVLYNLRGCLQHALRVVKPGGVILASTSTFVPLNPDGQDYWRNSVAGWAEVASGVWSGCEVVTTGYGNCLVAVAAMLGLAYEELSVEELEFTDPRYPVLVTLFCRKPAA